MSIILGPIERSRDNSKCLDIKYIDRGAINTKINKSFLCSLAYGVQDISRS